MSATPEKGTQEWGAQWAQGLWDGLFARFDPLIDGQVVLDLGCSWGYTLKFLSERFRPAQLIGVDLARRWQVVDHGWEYELLGGLVEFHAGHFAQMDEIAPSSVDLIISSSTLQYMSAEEVEASCIKACSVLRPGARRSSDPYRDFPHRQRSPSRVRHPLSTRPLGRPALESVTTEASRALPNLNFLTASSYLAIFNYAGFEIMDVRRRRSSAGVEERSRTGSASCSRESRMTNWSADLDVRLVKPIDPKDLPGLRRRRPTPMPPATSARLRWPAAEAADRYRVIVRIPGQGPLLELEVDGPEAVIGDLAPGDGEWPQWGVQVLDGQGSWVQHVPFLEWPSGPEGPISTLGWHGRRGAYPPRTGLRRQPRES